jgi:hypothetical protein
MKIDRDRLSLTGKRFLTAKLSDKLEKSWENSSKARGLTLLPV